MTANFGLPSIHYDAVENPSLTKLKDSVLLLSTSQDIFAWGGFLLILVMASQNMGSQAN